MANSFSRSPEIGGKDRDRRAPATQTVRERPRTQTPSRPSRDDDRDPTRTTGIGFLDAADAFLQQPQEPPDIVTPTERPGTLSPSDRSDPVLRPRLPAEEEDLPIIPGDPDDLGARGRRRRIQDDRNPSPVLRRGLLGV